MLDSEACRQRRTIGGYEAVERTAIYIFSRARTYYTLNKEFAILAIFSVGGRVRLDKFFCRDLMSFCCDFE